MKFQHNFLYEEANGDSGAGGGAGGGASLLSGAGASGGSGASGGVVAGDASGNAGGSGSGEQAGGQSSQAGTGGSPWFVGLWDNSGKINQAAFDKLPDDLKALKPTLSKYQTAETFLRGFDNLSKLAGKKALAPLPPNATPEMKAERATLMRQLNDVPEKPDGYGIKRPDNIPEDAWDEGYVNEAVGLLHKHNAPPSLVKELVEWDVKRAETMRAQMEAERAEFVKTERATLQKEWGNEYKSKIQSAARAAETLGLDPNDDVFASSKVVMAMARVAELVSESKLISGDSAGLNGHDDEAKFKDIVGNAANPLHAAYHNAGHPNHQAAVAQAVAFATAAAKRKNKAR